MREYNMISAKAQPAMPKVGSVQVVPANYISVVRRKHMDLYLRVQHLLPLFKVYRVSST